MRWNQLINIRFILYIFTTKLLQRGKSRGILVWRLNENFKQKNMADSLSRSHHFAWLKILPVFIVIFTVTSLVLVYLLATEVSQNVKRFPLPTLSATGSNYPESSIFSYSLNLTAFVLVVIMYFRFCSLRFQLEIVFHDDGKQICCILFFQYLELPPFSCPCFG